MPLTKMPAGFAYRLMPVVGNGVDAFKSVKKTLLCNWNGNVRKIGPHPDKLTEADFEPQDKGIPGVYGVDKDGNVVCSITLYIGDRTSPDPMEHTKHFNISKAKATGE